MSSTLLPFYRQRTWDPEMLGHKLVNDRPETQTKVCMNANIYVLNCYIILHEPSNHIELDWNSNFVTWMWSNSCVMVLMGIKCDKARERPVSGTQWCLSCSGSLGPTSGPPRGHSHSFFGLLWKFLKAMLLKKQFFFFFFFAGAMWIDF